MKALAFVALLALTSTAAGQDIIGQATVIDGDTIEIHRQRIRLLGIDAPESDQLGGADSELFRCGSAAASGLADHIAGHVVGCSPRATDRYLRVAAVCLADGAAKLTRANAAQVEALAKHRNKGQQKITIEHVHVYQGAQTAFIANATPGEGVGKIGKIQPHASTAAQRPALHCADPPREALPIAGNAERTLPVARRALAGSA